jgi:hypothetical protein
MVDILSGQVKDEVEDGKDAAAVELGRKGGAARARSNAAEKGDIGTSVKSG